MTFGTSTGRNGEAKMHNIVIDLPVDPPEVDFVHYGECEDRQFFQCPECQTLIPDSELNLCECNLKFIPRISGCKCDEINDFYFCLLYTSDAADE